MGEDELLTCYNTGCPVKKFRGAENSDSACVFHPSVPIFHDGIKRWPCCKRSSCDFTTLLSYPGCTTGPHNATKPAIPVVAKEQPVTEKEPEVFTSSRKPVSEFAPVHHAPLESRAPVSRDPEGEYVTIPAKTMPSLVAALGKMSVEGAGAQGNNNGAVSPAAQMKCGNFGCNAVQSESGDTSNDCLHHPKPPVFHEGLQFWGCCQKKHTDFEKFRTQPGCTYGSHNWTSGGKGPGGPTTTCRYDHFDNPTVLTLNIYAKNANPDLCSFEANNCRLKVNIVFGPQQQVFVKEFDLFSTIDPSKCVVNLNAAKVELKLSKSPVAAWKSIEVPVEKPS